MSFFDFHVHVALKPQFNKPENRDNPWTQLQFGLSGMDVVESQSCLTQLAKGEVTFVGIALHTPEGAMAKELKKTLTEESLFLTLIKCMAPGAYKKILTKVDMDRLGEIGSETNYYTLFTEELNNITSHLTSPEGQYKVKLLQSASDYNAADTNTVHGFFVVEGIHCFYGDQDITTDAGWQQFLTNLKSFTAKNRMFSINLAHLERNHVINHCFGIKIFKKEPFYPQGAGIVSPPDKVFALIEWLSEKNILIDIKHMSYLSRKQFYQWRDQLHEEKKKPIVCTHVGVTGVPAPKSVRYMDRPKKLTGEYANMWYVNHHRKIGYLNNTSFNMSSINLYDEDILAIVGSGGLIGVSFDKRIIGFTEPYDNQVTFDVEYLSTEELKAIVGDAPDYSDQEENVFEDTTLSADDKRNSILLDLRFFMSQIFHIITIGSTIVSREQAARSICLGSDFDGLIDSIDCCKTAANMKDFYTLAKSKYADLATEAQFDISGIEDLMDWIFMESGKSFVLNRL